MHKSGLSGEAQDSVLPTYSQNAAHTLKQSLGFACDTEAASECMQNSEAVPGRVAASVSACDFQWCGGGLAATDVMYLLWTSVSPAVILDCENDLLR